MAEITAAKRALLNKSTPASARARLGDLLSVCPVGAGLHTTIANATNVITVAGAAVGDMAVVSVNTNGATPRTITTARVSAANSLTVVLSGDPSTDHVLNYLVVRVV